MITLSIEQETCIKCGKCVRVCPSRIFVQETPKAEISTQHVENCISCGHCVAVCPTSSVLHSEFPSDKVHAIDNTLFPTPEQMHLIIRARRSNRAFSTKPIPNDMFELILEAAHAAPTASNLQQVEFTLVTNPEVLALITKSTIDVFAEALKKLTNPVLKPFLSLIMPDADKLKRTLNRITGEYEKGNDLILRKATAVLFIHTPAESRFGSQDSNLAYQNASLMAESLGVAHFYTGFVCNAVTQDKKQRLAKALGIEGKIHAGMAMGMPSFGYPNYIDKKDIKVKRF